MFIYLHYSAIIIINSSINSNKMHEVINNKIEYNNENKKKITANENNSNDFGMKADDDDYK